MLFLIKIAWMNSFRNARRTLLAGLAIGIGLAALIFTDGMMIGMSDTIVRIATDTFMGHGQVHAEGFRSTRDVARVVRGLPRLLERLRNDPEVERMTLRVQTPGMLASPATSGTVLLYGVDPGLERPFSRVDEAIVEGSFLERADRRKILVGSKLAEALEIGLGDRVVVTAAQAESGELAQDMFRVGGIFRFGVRELDGGVGFAHIETVQRLLGLPDEVHEIALHLKSFSGTEAMDAGFWSRFSRNGNEARSWRELMPQLSAILDMSGFSSLIVGVILFCGRVTWRCQHPVHVAARKNIRVRRPARSGHESGAHGDDDPVRSRRTLIAQHPDRMRYRFRCDVPLFRSGDRLLRH